MGNATFTGQSPIKSEPVPSNRRYVQPVTMLDLHAHIDTALPYYSWGHTSTHTRGGCPPVVGGWIDR